MVHFHTADWLSIAIGGVGGMTALLAVLENIFPPQQRRLRLSPSAKELDESTALALRERGGW